MGLATSSSKASAPAAASAMLLAAAAVAAAAAAAPLTRRGGTTSPIAVSQGGGGALLAGGRAFAPLPLGSLAPGGWLRAQLLLQANGVSGALPSSADAFPGAASVSASPWLAGGDGHAARGTVQWMPYWANGQVPLLALLRAADPSLEGLDPALGLAHFVGAAVNDALRTNASGVLTGFLGPTWYEPGDQNGHGLWDPLPMLRALLLHAQAVPALERDITRAVVGHLMATKALLDAGDPVISWAYVRWPTFAEIVQYVVDELVPKYGDDRDVMPLGGPGTAAALVNASDTFAREGMDWRAYYDRTGSVKFPVKGSVSSWNTIDHGVNNAEGAMRWPSVAWRRSGRQDDREAMALVLGMLDAYQGQVQSLFGADEVFAGRDPNRGTETCAVVEAMASLELAFTTFGDPALMDRVERLAFNALPASTTEDMWAHVYVQQANSVFAGRTGPARVGGRRRPEARAPCGACGGPPPSEEDTEANFFGVSHFPCCLTNLGQGWPKFAMHAVVRSATEDAFVVASLVPTVAHLPGGWRVETASRYPFGDDATITVVAPLWRIKSTTALVRIPGWATSALVNGQPQKNGTYARVACRGFGMRTTIRVELKPEVRLERGWGTHGVRPESAVRYGAASPAVVPSLDLDVDWSLEGGAASVGSREPGRTDIRTGNPQDVATITSTHPIEGAGHFLTSLEMSFRYVAGYTPVAGQTAEAPIVTVMLVDATNGAEMVKVWESAPLSNYSFDHYAGYSPPVRVVATGLRVPNSRALLVALRVENRERNLQLQLDPHGGFNVSVGWSAALGPDPPQPPVKWLRQPADAVAVVRGPLVYALHPEEKATVVRRYDSSRPKAVDYEVSTNDTALWNVALVLPTTRPRFDPAPSGGWNETVPFARAAYASSISVSARGLGSLWGFWHGSKVVDTPPPSPVTCTDGCAAAADVKLVPFGGTSIRIAAFPWTTAADDDDDDEDDDSGR